MSRRLRPGWLRLAVALLLMAVVLRFADPSRVLGLLHDADAAWLAGALASAVLANLASSLRWWSLVRWFGGRVGAAWATLRYFQGVAINALLPGAVVGGDVFRAHALVRRGMPAAEAGASVLFDRLSGLWALVVLGALAAAWGRSDGAWTVSLPVIGMPSAGVWMLLAALAWGAPLVLLAVWWAWLERHSAEPGGSGWRRLARLVHRPGLARQSLVQVAGSAVVQVLSVGTLACAAAALGQTLPWWAVAVAAVPTFLMATLPVSFGGWGTREAAAVASFGAFGVPASQAVAMSVVYGLAALAQGLVGALLLGAVPGGRAVEPQGESRSR